MKNGSVTIGNAQMAYVSFGRGTRTLVALPGLSDGLTTVKGKALILSLPYRKYLKNYTVYMFSRKEPMPEGYTVEAMADDQAAAMEALGIPKACLLGVSQGGMIALALAIRHPAQVEKLVLAVTAAHANDTVQEVVSHWIGMAERGDHEALMTNTAERTYSDGYLRRNRWAFPLLAWFTRPKSYDRFLKNARAILSFDARRDLSMVGCPTLIIGGGEDRIVGRDAALALHRAIAGSELFLYESLGHGAYEEAGDFYNRVLAFCQKGRRG